MNSPLYADPIMTLARAETGRGRLEHPRASIVLDNPLCGDRVNLDVDWSDDGKITALAHEVRGCVLCRAAAAAIGADACQRTREEIAVALKELEQLLRGKTEEIPSWPALTVFQPVSAHKSRHDCVLLPFEALIKGLTEPTND